MPGALMAPGYVAGFLLGLCSVALALAGITLFVTSRAVRHELRAFAQGRYLLAWECPAHAWQDRCRRHRLRRMRGPSSAGVLLGVLVGGYGTAWAVAQLDEAPDPQERSLLRLAVWFGMAAAAGAWWIGRALAARGQRGAVRVFVGEAGLWCDGSFVWWRTVTDCRVVPGAMPHLELTAPDPLGWHPGLQTSVVPIAPEAVEAAQALATLGRAQEKLSR